MERRLTRQIKVGPVLIGGDAPIAVQSMTNTKTQNVQATLEQIRKLADAGCDIIRCAVPDMDAALALKDEQGLEHQRAVAGRAARDRHGVVLVGADDVPAVHGAPLLAREIQRLLAGQIDVLREGGDRAADHERRNQQSHDLLQVLHCVFLLVYLR